MWERHLDNLITFYGGKGADPVRVKKLQTEREALIRRRAERMANVQPSTPLKSTRHLDPPPATSLIDDPSTPRKSISRVERSPSVPPPDVFSPVLEDQPPPPSPSADQAAAKAQDLAEQILSLRRTLHYLEERHSHYLKLSHCVD